MSVNTAIIVNTILDLSALSALAYACRRPFRASVARAETSTASQLSDQRGERLAA
jgi:hypothetical protein